MNQVSQPNPRLQRTPSASPPSPLSRQPFDPFNVPRRARLRAVCLQFCDPLACVGHPLLRVEPTGTATKSQDTFGLS